MREMFKRENDSSRYWFAVLEFMFGYECFEAKVMLIMLGFNASNPDICLCGRLLIVNLMF